MNASKSHDHIDSATLLSESITVNEPSELTDNDNKFRNKSEQTNSFWPNIFYGMGMLAFIIIPPLLTGASIRVLITGYMASIVGIYGVATIVSAVKVWRPRTNSRTNRARF